MVEVRPPDELVLAVHDVISGEGVEVAEEILGVIASSPAARAWMLEVLGEDVLSNVTIDGERQTWQQMYEREEEARIKADRWGGLVSDLDRCEHGRHELDVCSGCNGPSKGGTPTGTVLGHTISAEPIVMPERGQRHEVTAWVPAGGDR